MKKHILPAIIAAVITVLVGSAALIPQQANADIICKLDIVPQEFKDDYNFFVTDDWHFKSYSRSNYGTEEQRVDEYWLNRMLDISGKQFAKTNESILGRKLEPNGAWENKAEALDKFNKGKTVTPYERFGVAGLTWSGYLGEWKYLQKNVCSDDAPKDPKAGLFYEKRLVPQSTFDNRVNSQDIRTQQHLVGFGASSQRASRNALANDIFGVAKFVVTLALSLINLAFSDITKVIGVQGIITGDKNHQGLFKQLWDGIFIPLVVPIFAITALHILNLGIRHKQYRKALNTFFRSTLLFIIATVISLDPETWLALPNTIAILGQSVVITTLNGGLTSEGDLCSNNHKESHTDTLKKVHKKNRKETDTDAESQRDTLDEAAKSMRNAIGCTFWQEFLLKPWAEGQFGDEWNHLWAADKTPKWAPKGHKEITNTEKNQNMVGNAEIPLGGGATINNWALYQISTQTNAHSAYGKGASKGKISNGVHNDWWRIVDALSNYQEKRVYVDPQTGTIEDAPPGMGSDDENLLEASQENTSPIPAPSNASPLVKTLYAQVGKAYETGAVGPDKFDCSGLVYYALNQNGYKVPRLTAAGYGAISTPITKEQLQPGDILYSPTHIVMYVGNGKVVHAANHRKGVVEDTVQNQIAFNHLRPARLPKAPPSDKSLNGDIKGGEKEAPMVSTEETFSVPDTSAKPDSHWNMWVGGNIHHRVTTAFTALVVDTLGVSAPLFLSLMALIYAIEVSLLMAFAPIMLLLGCWDGRGWKMCKGWLDLTKAATIKRIIVGLLVVLSITFVDACISFMKTSSWWMGMIMLALVSVITIRSKDKIANAMQTIGHSGVLSSPAARVRNKSVGTVTNTLHDMRVSGTSGVAGGAAATRRARKQGMSIEQSVKYGVKGAHAAGSKIAKDRARSTVPGRAISDLKSTVRQAQKGINQPVYMIISGVRSLRDVEDADKRGTLSRDEARRRIVSVACRVNVDVKNKDGIPTVPPEIAPYINYKDIRSALDSGRYDYVNKMYAKAWTRYGKEKLSRTFAHVSQSDLRDMEKDIYQSMKKRQQQ